MEPVTRLATLRPVAVTVLAAVVVLLGALSWRQLPVELMPDLDSPTLVVSLTSGDRPPEEMELVYGERLERRLLAVRGLREVLVVARTGRLLAMATFAWESDMDLALVEVQKEVAELEADPEVDELVVRRWDPREAPVVVAGMVAPEGVPDLVELRRLARRQVATTLERVPGVAEVSVQGGRELEVRVVVDPAALEGHGLTLGDLERRLDAANVDIDAGTLERGSRVYALRARTRLRRSEDVAAVVVSQRQGRDGAPVPVRLADVARVEEVEAEIHHLVRLDGREGVSLSVYKEGGANTVAVSRRVRRALERLGEDLAGVEATVVSDRAVLVERAIEEVQGAAGLGILLALVVLAVFLRSTGPTLVIAVAVPVSLLAALGGLRLSGHTLNLMTLGGLALAAGMLVDNAIVVVESIYARWQRGEAASEAIPRATADVGGALAASTLTTCAVFLPVLFVEGAAARLVDGMAYTVVVSLLASLAVAMLLIPALSVWLLPGSAPTPGGSFGGRVSRGLERLIARLLSRKGLVLGVSSLLVVLAVTALLSLGTELLPALAGGQVTVRIDGPASRRVEVTEAVVEGFERALTTAAGGEVKALLAEVGRLPENDRLPRTEFSTEGSARIHIAVDAEVASDVLTAAAAAVESLPETEVSWESATALLAPTSGTSRSPLLVELSGRVLDDLRRATRRLERRLERCGELTNLRSSLAGGPPEVRLEIDRAVVDGLGVELDEIERALAAALDGHRVITLSIGDEERPVRLYLPEHHVGELTELSFTTEEGALVALGSLGRLELRQGAREIQRRNQRRIALLEAAAAPGVTYPAALATLEAELAAVDLPPGVEARVIGQEEERQRTFAQLRWAGLVALLLVFMVLAGTFESLLQPLTILAALPLALVGVALLLVPVGQPIGAMAGIGLIVLVGIAVNNSILLVVTVRRLRASGLDRERALARAAALRLRPIAMTTATTVLALLPLAVGFGEAAELRAPMALTVIGGLLASTVATLLVVPCLYAVLDRLHPGGDEG